MSNIYIQEPPTSGKVRLLLYFTASLCDILYFTKMYFINLHFT